MENDDASDSDSSGTAIYNYRAMQRFEEHEFTHVGRKTFYVATGPDDGPLLIFVHGWPAIGKLFDQNRRQERQ